MKKTVMTPADPDFALRIRQSFARQGLMTSLGARLRTVDPGHVVIELPFSAALSEQRGNFHGGVLGAIGDSAGGYASMSLMPAGAEVTTVEYKINFLRPARAQLLVADGRVVRAGKSISVVRVDVSATDSGQSEVVALLQATFMRVD